MPIEQVTGFKTLKELTDYLNVSLEKSYGISFHNQGGFYIMDDDKGGVYEMRYSGEGRANMGRTFPFVGPFFKPSTLSICYPFFRKSDSSEPDKDVIALGPEGRIWGIPRGNFEDTLIDSKKYGPRILKVTLCEPHQEEPQFDFRIMERVFWDKSAST